ncbi:MAG: hypothetical protein SCH71_05080 [Desulfobulbaceae bacterium]|nr:hypothetical protein [Desulfobulbaceae bacterium]
MNKRLFISRFLATAFLAAVLINGCSGEIESEAEKTEGYESRSAGIGHEAAQSIKAPMESARNAVDIENKRMQEYENRLGE